ncbi:M18 family aminopeptidase [Oceanirhabdus sp. W0125-5]|uniref:M18 family aminopeptidase n=1 Tax=Oceanirhabdus sp. W0125-5 TaxID=2999116 RepID=UPI0022F34105|nr:M18 family aminopeptidase [Oceanirhabdus sp. W0125-5]WBW98757.1 M18 family aminopeptidase [Oceanirhabdus sp. W0125-5]
MNEKMFAQELIDFLYDSPTAFHAVENVEEQLMKENFVKLNEGDEWKIEKGGKYFTTKNGSALIAFTVGSDNVAEKGFRLIGAHTDSPGFRIKPNAEMVAEKSYLKLNTEVYGGPILNTWLDRPLSVAGRVTLMSENPLKPEIKLMNVNRPIMIIPNLSIHMNREVNKGVELNRQNHVLPLVGMINEKLEKDNFILKLIAEELNVEMDNIIDFDLFLYEFEKGCLVGFNEEFISSARLDDLQNVHSGIKALVDCKNTTATNVMVCYDNEEIGSSTKQGADSEMLAITLERIVLALGGTRDDYLRSIAHSFIISADNAHAVHPNYVEKHDPTNRPIINNGPVIKINANQSYTTDSESGAVFEMLCKKCEVPYQKFVNRSDVRGGSTIGPINSTHLNMRSVDIGLPQFAMHSIREMAGVKDHLYAYKVYLEFFNL